MNYKCFRVFGFWPLFLALDEANAISRFRVKMKSGFRVWVSREVRRVSGARFARLRWLHISTRVWHELDLCTLCLVGSRPSRYSRHKSLATTTPPKTASAASGRRTRQVWQTAPFLTTRVPEVREGRRVSAEFTEKTNKSQQQWTLTHWPPTSQSLTDKASMLCVTTTGRGDNLEEKSPTLLKRSCLCPNPSLLLLCF